MANRQYQYISRRKLSGELKSLEGSRSVKVSKGAEGGASVLGLEAKLSWVKEPVTESEVTLVAAVEELEDLWRRRRVQFSTPWEAEDGQIFYVQTKLHRVSLGGSAVWWGGVVDRVALVLTGSSVHLLGNPPEPEDHGEQWASALEWQWGMLAGYPVHYERVRAETGELIFKPIYWEDLDREEQQRLKFASPEDNAVRFALEDDSTGVTPPQFLEACVLTNTTRTLTRPDLDRLVLGSPYFVALLH